MESGSIKYKSFLPHISLLSPARFLTNSLQSQDRYTLVLFFSGSGQCHAGKNQSFSAGDVLLAHPGCDVSFVFDEAPISPIAAIQFPLYITPSAGIEEPLMRWMDQYLSGEHPAVWLHLSSRQLSELQSLFHTLYAEHSSDQPGSGALTQLLFKAILGWLARVYHLEQPINRPGNVPRGNDLVAHVRKIVALEYAEPLTLEAVARRCYVTPTYLSSLFHEKTGLSFNRCLNLTRVSHACRLLLDTDELAVDIGVAVGFNSAPHFNLTFHKLTGFTPLEYRRHFKRTGTETNGVFSSLLQIDDAET